MKIEEMEIKKTTYQTMLGENVFRKLRTHEYEFLMNGELIAYAKLDTMLIEYVHPMTMYMVIDSYYQTSWEYFVHHFDNKAGFAGNGKVRNAKYYRRIAMIDTLIVSKKYKNQGITRDILKYLYAENYDCGVFFLQAFDLKESDMMKSIVEQEKSKFDEMELDSTKSLHSLVRDGFHNFESIDELNKIYKKLDFQTLDSNYNTYCIEPLIAHPELFKTNARKTKRFAW